jgi:hypothetical protein
MVTILNITEFTEPNKELIVTIVFPNFYKVEGTEEDIINYLQLSNGREAALNEVKYFQSLDITSVYEKEAYKLNSVVRDQSEIDTYHIQELECRLYRRDNTSITPFIDELLVNSGNSKNVQVGKILAKSDQYKIDIGYLLGKKQKYIDLIINASTIDEALSINWI